MKVKHYLLPNGRMEETEVSHIQLSDQQWFKGNKVELSMEQLRTGKFALYADFTDRDCEDHESEVVVVTDNRTPAIDAFHQLREVAEEYLNNVLLA